MYNSFGYMIFIDLIVKRHLSKVSEEMIDIWIADHKLIPEYAREAKREAIAFFRAEELLVE